jgi:4a-hydroxytetrahydrobiopterin dehydratase
MNYIITEEQEKRLVKGWKIREGQLTKIFDFETYKDVLKFVNKVGLIAEKQNHHPDMLVKYNSVKVSLFDHEANKVSDKCHNLAHLINKI